MPRFLAAALLGLLLTACAASAPQAAWRPGAHGKTNPVADKVNNYRVQQGLPRVPVSAALTRVAQAHVADLEANFRQGGKCNMHSWSGKGRWKSCCYTPDHRQAACMWDKPREIAGTYTSPGYEIVAHYTDPMSPAMALEIWQESPAHHAMILNTRQWRDRPWHAMGAAMGAHYAVVWFGEAADAAPD